MTNIFITLAIIGLIVFIGLILWRQQQRHSFSSQDQKQFQKHWSRILAHAQKSPNAAIMEADKLLDHALKSKGYQGSLGNKLKQAGSLFSNEQSVWEAHKLRNRIAHELDVKLSEKQTRDTLHYFKQGLKDLGLNL